MNRREILKNATLMTGAALLPIIPAEATKKQRLQWLEHAVFPDPYPDHGYIDPFLTCAYFNEGATVRKEYVYKTVWLDKKTLEPATPVEHSNLLYPTHLKKGLDCWELLFIIRGSGNNFVWEKMFVRKICLLTYTEYATTREERENVLILRNYPKLNPLKNGKS
jgi:hypothetical protein